MSVGWQLVCYVIAALCFLLAAVSTDIQVGELRQDQQHTVDRARAARLRARATRYGCDRAEVAHSSGSATR